MILASDLPYGYEATVTCASCGVLRFDRVEDLPLDSRVRTHILGRHDCSKHDVRRAAWIYVELCLAVRRGDRPTLSEVMKPLFEESM